MFGIFPSTFGIMNIELLGELDDFGYGWLILLIIQTSVSLFCLLPFFVWFVWTFYVLYLCHYFIQLAVAVRHAIAYLLNPTVVIKMSMTQFSCMWSASLIALPLTLASLEMEKLYSARRATSDAQIVTFYAPLKEKKYINNLVIYSGKFR